MSGPGLKVGFTLKHLQSIFSRALVLARFMFRVGMDLPYSSYKDCQRCYSVGWFSLGRSQTLNPEPSTLNPKPSTINPHLGRRSFVVQVFGVSPANQTQDPDPLPWNLGFRM